ncbi:endonuclease G, mitochondrial-like isoform X2 [Branchiostoma floridae]|uniref:Endonuclease G, mitochondrial-like isoform X2 n=1 Tax=Branchiostoma floridae TaxID=7739 RepID=A0A9J7LKK1_BRAFL|nr:endonuclease G, mitochondrial-like isoform X2 [Branchiostoma floridae]
MPGARVFIVAFAVGFAVAAWLLGNVNLPENLPLMSFVMKDDVADFCSQSHNDSAPVAECIERHSNLQSDCDHFFVGDAWPSSGYMKNDKDATLRICHTHAGDSKLLFATAYNAHYRIPEYTASAITRDPDLPEQDRPSSSLWDRVQLGLCGKKVHDTIYVRCDEVETDSWGVTRMSDIWKVSGTRCRLSPSFDDLKESHCGDCQGLDSDYSGCGTTFNRGHINPNSINNKDADVQDGTFSMINAAPQDDDFNQHAWQAYERAVGRKAEEVYKNAVKAGSNSRTLYVITGTKLGEQTTWMKGRVAIPGYFWKALCYPGDERAGLRPFGVGFYGPNIDDSEVTSLPLDQFEAWLYDGADEHLFPGSVCAGPVDNWDGLDDYVAEIAHDCRNEHMQETCESKKRIKRCGTSG